MAKAKSITTIGKPTTTKKKTRQGMGRGTKLNTTPTSKRFKKKYRGQGK